MRIERSCSFACSISLDCFGSIVHQIRHGGPLTGLLLRDRQVAFAPADNALSSAS
jgi:hypothetical protein